MYGTDESLDLPLVRKRTMLSPFFTPIINEGHLSDLRISVDDLMFFSSSLSFFLFLSRLRRKSTPPSVLLFCSVLFCSVLVVFGGL
jgi:hypothetical protein